MMSTQAIFVSLLVGSFGCTFLLLATVWLLGKTPSERFVVWVSILGCLASMAGGIGLLPNIQHPVHVSFGSWFHSGEHYAFPLDAEADQFSVPIALLTTLLVGVISSFSRRYLHREPGFFRFFLVMNLFAFGAQVVTMAGSFDIIIGGWELVGLSSVLLIGFFRERTGPVDSALRVFAVYRVSDIGLLVGVFALHHYVGTTTFVEIADHGKFGSAWIPALLLLFGAMGKSAQAPFSGWLPLAMEGPTPSSAIFYGAISVHMGAFLLLRSLPLLEHAPWVSALVVLVGLASAFHGTLTGRASADAKSSVAYAALTQVGLIFVEIGLGYPRLALWHIMGHSLIRTLQFLRTPSMLREHHQIITAAGGQLPATGRQYELLLPKPIQLWLYRWALDRGHFDHFLNLVAVRPIYALGQFLSRIESAIITPLPPPERGLRRMETEILGEVD